MFRTQQKIASAKGLDSGLLCNTIQCFPHTIIPHIPSHSLLSHQVKCYRAALISDIPGLHDINKYKYMIMTRRLTATNYNGPYRNNGEIRIGTGDSLDNSEEEHAKLSVTGRHQRGQEEGDIYRRYWEWLQKAGCEHKGLQLSTRPATGNTAPLRGLFNRTHTEEGNPSNYGESSSNGDGGPLMFKEGAILASIPVTACLSPVTYEFLLLNSRMAREAKASRSREADNNRNGDILPSNLANNDPYFFLEYSVPTMADLLSLRVYVSSTDGKKSFTTLEYIEACYMWLGCIISATRKQELNKRNVDGGPPSLLPAELPYSHIISMFPASTASFVSGIEYHFSKGLKTSEEKQDFMNIHRENSEIMTQVAALCAKQAKKERKLAITIEMLEWGYRCAVSRAVMIPHNVSTNGLEVSAYLEGLDATTVSSQAEEMTTTPTTNTNTNNRMARNGLTRKRTLRTKRQTTVPIIAPCIIPLVDFINHPTHQPQKTPETEAASSITGNACIFTSMMGGYRHRRQSSGATNKEMKMLQKEENTKSKIDENKPQDYDNDGVVPRGSFPQQNNSKVDNVDEPKVGITSPTPGCQTMIILDEDDVDNENIQDISGGLYPTDTSPYSKSCSSLLALTSDENEMDILADHIEHCVVILSATRDIYPGEEIVMEYDLDDAPAALYRYGFLQ